LAVVRALVSETVIATVGLVSMTIDHERAGNGAEMAVINPEMMTDTETWAETGIGMTETVTEMSVTETEITRTGLEMATSVIRIRTMNNTRKHSTVIVVVFMIVIIGHTNQSAGDRQEEAVVSLLLMDFGFFNVKTCRLILTTPEK
jgi:hypothetical protein